MAFPNYDREYERNLNLARRLIWKIKDKADRSIALKYVNLLTHLKSDDVTVKRNRNAFFKYFIQVLEDQLNTEARTKIQCTCAIPNEESMSDPLKYLQKEVINTGERVVCNWSKDKRTYISAKILPGRGALLYMAVSSKANDWDFRGQQKKG
ncbi:UNVERIFIED_CONTAM: hypothetical protein PYX00_005095 [Menopon gallinae]|uniref:Uncharacterized protein n=1 Tax=Menopon gallinae TaxID=328185 RepID=A0AAW2HQR5_9NEOP